MSARTSLLAVLSAGVTVAVLVTVWGPGVAVFLFFAAGLSLAALYGEAGTAPAPEGGGPSAVDEGVGGAGDTMEFAERDAPAARRNRSVDWGSAALAYAAGLCLWSVAALLAVALFG